MLDQLFHVIQGVDNQQPKNVIDKEHTERWIHVLRDETKECDAIWCKEHSSIVMFWQMWPILKASMHILSHNSYYIDLLLDQWFNQQKH